MNRVKSDDTGFPEDFLEHYELLECLSFKRESETYYVKDKLTGEYGVAKCYVDKSILSRNSEGCILRSLRHKGLPRFLGEYENDEMLCVVREYVQGRTLMERLEESPMTEAEAFLLFSSLRYIDLSA